MEDKAGSPEEDLLEENLRLRKEIEELREYKDTLLATMEEQREDYFRQLEGIIPLHFAYSPLPQFIVVCCFKFPVERALIINQFKKLKLKSDTYNTQRINEESRNNASTDDRSV